MTQIAAYLTAMALPKLRKCIHCSRAALRRRRTCAKCASLCPKCLKNKRQENRGYCNGCDKIYQKNYRDNYLSEEQRIRTYLRCKVNREIRKGKRLRESCSICQREPGFCYFPNLTIETMTFLCREHLDQITDRYGMQASFMRQYRADRRKGVSNDEGDAT